jgi:putative transposase
VVEGSRFHFPAKHTETFQKQNDAPRFKSRKNQVQAYTSQCNYSKNSRPTIEIDRNKIKLPKLGWVKFVPSRTISGRILSAPSVVPHRENTAYPFFVRDATLRSIPARKEAIDIDLGLKDFSIFDDGTKTKPNQFFRQYERKLAKLQQTIARRKKTAPTGTKPVSKWLASMKKSSLPIMIFY